jgi:TolB-like protein/Flp pilus assembly protein TadD
MQEERHTAPAGACARVVRVGAFELDLRAGELRKRGRKIRLQEQPFRIFLMLLERPGEVVLRQEIRNRLWPNDTFVQFAPSINAAIQRLREALGDSADAPRYVETVGRRGYRLLEKVADGAALEHLGAGSNSLRSNCSIAAPETCRGRARISIAVLPFVNANSDPDVDYLSEGVTESIINRLSRIAWLRVVPRSIAFRFKGKDLDLVTIGRELNVGLVLAGSVTLRAERLMVSTELIDVTEASQVWGERYNRKLADIFEVEEKIAKNISGSLWPKLDNKQQEHLSQRQFTENREAYLLYLRGRHHWGKRTPDSIRRASEYFQQAIDKDPGYSLAYSGLADCYSQLCVTFAADPPKECWARAKAAAAAAVALEPDLAEGHTSMAFVRAFGDWDWTAAECEFQRAIELNPSYWAAPYWLGVTSTARGLYEDADRWMKIAWNIEPLSPIIAHGAAFNLIARHAYADAINVCQSSIDISPDYPLLRLWLGIALEQQSRYDEAIIALEKAAQLLGGQPIALGSLGHACSSAGRQSEALRILDQLLKLHRQTQIDPYSVVLIYAGLGWHNETIEWLEKACGSHCGLFAYVAQGDPRLEPLRSEPGFINLLHRMRQG